MHYAIKNEDFTAYKINSRYIEKVGTEKRTEKQDFKPGCCHIKWLLKSEHYGQTAAVYKSTLPPQDLLYF